MSHDHPHHDHDHEHGHGHDHDHKHEHSHEPKRNLKDIDLPLMPKRSGTPAKEPKRPKVIEDAGTEALSDALKSSFWFVKGIFALLILGLFFSCFRQVHPHEVAVVLRFGKIVGIGKEAIRPPGMVFVLPYPIDELVRIPVAGTHSIRSTAGWHGRAAEYELSGESDVPPDAQSLKPGVDGYAITGDENIIHTRVTLNYTIDDPVAYAFSFANVTNVLENILNDTIIRVSAQFSSADALYENPTAYNDAIRARIEQKTQVENKLGIKISLVTVDTKVPIAVKVAFNGVQTAVDNKNKQINEARGYAGETLSKADAEASTILNRGMSRSNQVVQAVSAESRSFLSQLPYYQRDPGLFEDRLLAQTMGRVMTNAADKFFIPTSPDGRSRELRLQLNREPEKPKMKRYQ